jgi:hypothetical protein
MGSGCYVVVCCSINIVRVFIIVDTVTESDVTIVSCSCSVLKSRSIKTNSRCRAFNKNQLSLSSVPPPYKRVSPPLNKRGNNETYSKPQDEYLNCT